MNGCHDRAPFSAKRIVQDGRYEYSLAPITVSIPNFSYSAECQYTKSDLGQRDKGCTSCKHRNQDDLK